MMHNIAIFLETIVFIYFSYIAGQTLLNLLRFNLVSIYRKISYPIMFGFGIYALAGLILGLFGKFNSLYLGAFTLLIVLTGISTIASNLTFLNKNLSRASFKNAFKKLYAENTTLKILLTVWLILNIFILFVPITGHDALDYHLPIIQDLIQNEKISFIGGDFLQIPVLGEIMYAVPLALFGNDSAPYIFQLLQYSFLLLFLLIIYDFVRGKIKNSFLSLVSLFLVLSLMDFLREVMHGGYVDVLCYLFAFTSTLIIIDVTDEPVARQKELMLSALFLGISLGVKYTALFFGLINVLFLVIVLLYQKVKWPEIIRLVLSYPLIIYLIAGFWYVKNSILFGNPFYPMYSDPVFDSQVHWFVIPPTFLNFFAFPFYTFDRWFFSDRESSSRLLVFVYFILTYIGVAFFAVMRKRFSLAEILSFVFVELYLLLLFVSSHQIRFLLPSLIMLTVTLALLTDKFLLYIKEKKQNNIYQKLLTWAKRGSIAIFIIIFLGNIHYFEIKFRYILGLYTEKEYTIVIGGQ